MRNNKGEDMAKNKKLKKRLGRVVVDLGYVVDIENPEMVEHAKRCLYDDIMTADNNQNLNDFIEIHEDKKAKISEIPEFLLEDEG